MIQEFEPVVQEIVNQVNKWEPILMGLTNEVITARQNSQNRTIKQIVGHMVDSVSNNTHRIVHLQYQQSPLQFPNYATHGNNDRWIAIQNYRDEQWENLVQLWKYAHLHIIHVIENVNPDKLDNEWIAGDIDDTVSLKAMVIDFPRHLALHLNEVNELIMQK